MFAKVLNNKKVFSVIIIIVLILLIIFVVKLLFNDNIKLFLTDAELIEKEYEKLNNKKIDSVLSYPVVELPSNNIYKYTTIDEFLEIFDKKKSAVVLFSSPTCLYCRSAIEVLSNVAMETEFDIIYYLDVETTDKNYDKLLNKLGSEFIYEIKEENIRYIYEPLVLFIVNGNIITSNKYTIISHVEPHKRMTEAQVKSLSYIYKVGLDVVINK